MTAHRNTSWFWWLLASAVLTVLLWRVTWGHYALYPFTILATWFHEMGHGLTALLTGGSFKRLLLWPNGSGLATTSSGAAWLGPFGPALVAAGGPLGPVFAGAAFILSGRKPRSSAMGLYILGLVLLVSVVIWVRTLFGLGAIIAWGLAILALAFKAPDSLKQFSIQFLGVQACISAYRQIDYLFIRQVTIGGQTMVSDTGAIQGALLLPYWFWALLIIALSAFILIKTLAVAVRST